MENVSVVMSSETLFRTEVHLPHWWLTGYVRSSLARGGKGKCAVGTDINDTDGTVLSLYASRVDDDGFSTSYTVQAPYQMVTFAPR